MKRDTGKRGDGADKALRSDEIGRILGEVELNIVASEREGGQEGGKRPLH